jgi:hypothetical protein
VSVNNEVPIIKNTNLNIINPARFNPSGYILINFHTNTGLVPGVINIFNNAVITISIRMGFNPFQIYLNGTFEIKIEIKVKHAINI